MTYSQKTPYFKGGVAILSISHSIELHLWVLAVPSGTFAQRQYFSCGHGRGRSLFAKLHRLLHHFHSFKYGPLMPLK